MPRPQLHRCPRCGERAFELMPSYAHCVSCLHFEDHHYDAEAAFHTAIRAEKWATGVNQESGSEDALAAS